MHCHLLEQPPEWNKREKPLAKYQFSRLTLFQVLLSLTWELLHLKNTCCRLSSVQQYGVYWLWVQMKKMAQRNQFNTTPWVSLMSEISTKVSVKIWPLHQTLSIIDCFSTNLLICSWDPTPTYWHEIYFIDITAMVHLSNYSLVWSISVGVPQDATLQGGRESWPWFEEQCSYSLILWSNTCAITHRFHLTNGSFTQHELLPLV